MKAIALKKIIGAVLCGWLALASVAATAASGYMSFVLNSQVKVDTGDAASYMQVGRDWSGADTDINAQGIAQPKLQQKSTITTSRTATHLVLRFEIPDRTTTWVNDPTGTTNILSCGDKVVVQINPNSSTGASLEPGPSTDPDPLNRTINRDYRYEVTIKNLAIRDFNGTLNKPDLYYPSSGTQWFFAALRDTNASATLVTPVTGNKYDFTLTIPLGEIGTPTNNIGLALAIINDLGHSHGPTPVQEAAGTAFPSDMGITAQSEPGVVQCGGSASGNWVNPSTWGTGYFSLGAISPQVILDQSPAPWISEAIRLGTCDKVWSEIGAVNAANWTAQTGIANWYQYHPNNPCRMGIWINAKVPQQASAGVLRRRFLVVWGRPGISPQEWYFAGLTAPVAIPFSTATSGTATPVSFIWNDVQAVSFTDHPCLRVYVLPETLNPKFDEAAIRGIDTDAELSQMESIYGVHYGMNQTAQMNFTALVPNTSCTTAACMRLGSWDAGRRWAALGDWSMFSQAVAQPAARELAIPAPRELAIGVPIERDPIIRTRSLVRVIATGFAVSPPTGKQRYVYVEEIGGMGWVFSSTVAGTLVKNLTFDVANPRVATKTLVQARAVELAAPTRNISLAMDSDSLPGMPVPKFSAQALEQIGQRPLKAGEVIKAQIPVERVEAAPQPQQPGDGSCSCGDFKCMYDRERKADAGEAITVAGLFLIGGIGIGGVAFVRRRKPKPEKTEEQERQA